MPRVAFFKKLKYDLRKNKIIKKKGKNNKYETKIITITNLTRKFNFHGNKV